MYLEHFGLNEAPFRITPHTDFFFAGGNRGATLDALLYAITHDEGIVKVSGEVGSGKTMLCRVLMERLPTHVVTIYLANPSLSREDILFAIADELHIDLAPDMRAAMVLRLLQDRLIEAFSTGKQVVVLIDEAHAMPVETLEEIRLLSNLESNRNKLLQLVLFGQPELNEILARADMRQLKERITHNFALEPLIRDDISIYLDFRLRAAGYKGPALFSDKAVHVIAKTSQGLTRRVNILADKCLLCAYSRGSHAIGTREVVAAVNDCDFSAATRTSRRTRFGKIIGAVLALATAAAIGAGFVTLSGLHLVNTTLIPGQHSRAMILETNQTNGPADTPTATLVVGSTSTMPVADSSSPAVNGVPGGVATLPGAPIPDDKIATLPIRTSAPDDSPAGGISPNTSANYDPTLGTLTRKGLDAGRHWLSSVDDTRWFLQLLLSSGDRSRDIELFLRNASASGLNLDEVKVYATEVDGVRRFGVIYGEFDSRAAATLAIKMLPRAALIGKPFPRQVSQLR